MNYNYWKTEFSSITLLLDKRYIKINKEYIPADYSGNGMEFEFILEKSTTNTKTYKYKHLRLVIVLNAFKVDTYHPISAIGLFRIDKNNNWCGIDKDFDEKYQTEQIHLSITEMEWNNNVNNGTN